MKIIKSKCLKTYNALIVFLLSLLGFASSCDIQGGKAMYGTPSADFIVKGKVENTLNKPIAGIKVEMSKMVDTGAEELSVPLDSILSVVSTGIYEVTASDQFPKEQIFNVKFTDVDGLLNGEYESLDTTVVFQNPKFTNGTDAWYQGQTEKEVDVKLKPKK